MGILVAKVLAEIEFLLSIYCVLRRHPIDGHASSAVGRNMYQPCIVEQTESDAMRCTSNIDILNFSAFREVLHHGCAIEHGVHFSIYLDFLSHIAVDDAQTIAEQLVVVLTEVIIQHTFQTAFGLFLVLRPNHAPNDRHIVTVNEFLEYMDAQEARGTRNKRIANGLAFAIAECLNGVGL